MEIKSEFIKVIVPQRNSQLACLFKYLHFIGKKLKTCGRRTKLEKNKHLVRVSLVSLVHYEPLSVSGNAEK